MDDSYWFIVKLEVFNLFLRVEVSLFVVVMFETYEDSFRCFGFAHIALRWA